MKKKVVALLMTVAMAATLLAGCGSAQEETKAPESSQKTEETKPADAASDTSTEKTPEERITISVMGVDWGYGPKSDSEMEQYWEDLYDVNLEIEWVNYEDYHQKINTLISAGSQPDVVQIYKLGGTYYYPIFTQAIDAGQFLDMTEYIHGEGGLASTNAVMKNWSDSMWEQSTYNGGIYILPRSKAEISQSSGIEVRRDLMVKYGYEEEPTTMDELKDWLIGLSKAATEGEGQKIYALDWYGDDFMNDRAKAFAIAFTGQTDWEVNEAGEFEYMQFDENYINFLDWFKDLYEAGVLDPEFALGNADTSKFKAGNSVAYLNQWYNCNQSADKTTNKIFDKGTPDTYECWELLPVKGPEAYTVSPNYTDVDSCIAISANCSDEKIAKIMEVFNGTEEAIPGYDVLMSNGVEGIHYTLLEDGTFSSDETQGQKKTEGYVGAWNQIFLKVDADQLTSKFMRVGAKRASDELIARATEVRDFVYEYTETSGIANAITNLYSETYNNTWATLTDDVNTWCTQYVMGELSADDFKSNIASVVESSDYKAIQAEFKAAAAAGK